MRNINSAYIEYPGRELTMGVISAFANIAIDAADEKAAMIFQIPKTGTLTHVGIRFATVTNSQSVDVRIETVSASDGNPTGTLYDANGTGVIATPAQAASYEVALNSGNGIAVTRGDIVAIVIQFTSTIGNLLVSVSGGGTGGAFPYYVSYTTAWGAKAGAQVLTFLKYGNEYVNSAQFVGAHSSTYTEISTTGTYDMEGMLFSPPAPIVVEGMLLNSYSTRGNYDIHILDKSGNALSSASVNVLLGAGANPTGRILLNESVLLIPGIEYRAVAEGKSSTSFRLYYAEFMNATIREYCNGTIKQTLRTRTSGAWTDSSTRIPSMSIFGRIFDDGRKNSRWRFR